MGELLVIAGSDAGISAALRARGVDPRVEVTVVMADSFPNFSVCGLPFYISGEVPEWRSLAHRTAEEIERQGIRLLLNHTATAIDPAVRAVQVEDPQGQPRSMKYDRLVLATGARPRRPDIPGHEETGVHVLHTMGDSFRVHQTVADAHAQTAVIVGAGYIALDGGCFPAPRHSSHAACAVGGVVGDPRCNPWLRGRGRTTQAGR